ncbi:EPIDERMAL PATTERNING FACTOR-like protein 9 [Malania oleifera]|uniref:EPIDERMAL PATTERNING FACTOR-like protein 9 n=1 Tax=Malania oleifera TaxID=397392 RepID=UPI0025AE44B8|nr:EPIDERMAL PATTERNING FACTOR-like protein 9 [Malania oleifera]
MASAKKTFLSLFFTLILAAYVIQGSTTQVLLHYHQMLPRSSTLKIDLNLQGGSRRQMSGISRRMMIGSTAPTCTYNECRGCKYKCRAEQVPVEGNDPMNSAYHYKCVCHR